MSFLCVILLIARWLRYIARRNVCDFLTRLFPRKSRFRPHAIPSRAPVGVSHSFSFVFREFEVILAKGGSFQGVHYPPLIRNKWADRARPTRHRKRDARAPMNSKGLRPLEDFNFPKRSRCGLRELWNFVGKLLILTAKLFFNACKNSGNFSSFFLFIFYFKRSVSGVYCNLHSIFI